MGNERENRPSDSTQRRKGAELKSELPVGQGRWPSAKTGRGRRGLSRRSKAKAELTCLLFRRKLSARESTLLRRQPLRPPRHIAAESVDLIYLDPPFNSKRDYNLLFKSPKGQASEAQIEAFEDSWHWNPQAEREFDELLHQPNTDVAEMMKALRAFLGENDMMAYLTMMANRLLQLHRVLKPTGSLYLHCDPTASHYLKIVLDGVFGKENFSNEIIWKRTTPKNDSQQGAMNWPRDSRC